MLGGVAKNLRLDPEGKLHRYRCMGEVRPVVMEIVELMLEVDWMVWLRLQLHVS